MYLQRISYYPNLGKEREVRTLLEDELNRRRNLGARGSLAVALTYEDGPYFTVTYLHESLSAYEEFRKRAVSEPDFRAHQPGLADMLRFPLKHEILELLAPPEI